MSQSRSLRAPRAQHGVVLPIVLVLLVVLTSLVLVQIRRGTLDQQLSINSRQYSQIETSAQSALRWCEARALVANTNTTVEKVDVSLITPVRPPGVQPGTAAAWKTDSNWTQHEEILAVGVALSPAVAQAECLYEDASQDLEQSTVQTDTSLERATPDQGAQDLSAGATICPKSSVAHFCKYRVTVRITPTGLIGANPCTTSPRSCLLMQSELRFSY